MRYVYILIGIILISGGVFYFSQIQQSKNIQKEQTNTSKAKSAQNLDKSAVSEKDIPIQQEITPKPNVTRDADSTSFTFSGFGFGYPYKGTFSDVKSKIQFTNNEFAGAEFHINPGSVDTGFFAIDSQLQSTEFLNTPDYPEIIFVITNKGFASGATANMYGVLTIRGITNTFEFSGVVKNSSVSADFSINASDFRISDSRVEDEILVHIFTEWEEIDKPM